MEARHGQDVVALPPVNTKPFLCFLHTPPFFKPLRLFD